MLIKNDNKYRAARTACGRARIYNSTMAHMKPTTRWQKKQKSCQSSISHARCICQILLSFIPGAKGQSDQIFAESTSCGSGGFIER